MSEASIQTRDVRDQSLPKSDHRTRRQTRGPELEEKLGSPEATVGVVGLGYVGLPLGLTIAEAGKRAMGFDVDRAKIDRLRAGESYIRHIAAERIARRLSVARSAEELSNNGGSGFLPTTDFSALAHCDANDIMAWGTQVLWYHGRVLWEHR